MCLVLMGASLLVVASGVLWLYPLGAILLGMSAVSTPASSHILARICPPRLAPVIFSVKQVGVPVGSLIGGLLIPFLLGLGIYSAVIGGSIHLDAYGAAFVTALVVYGVALSLQPIRAYFDTDRDSTVKPSFSGISETMKIVLSNHDLRDLAFAAFSFGGMQSIFSGFFILFLIDGLDYTETEAGSAFAIASVTAIGARIMWGWVGSAFVSPRVVMAAIGLFGSIAGILTGFYDTGWSFEAIVAVAILYNITVLSWHGILLAETARLAPAGKVGGVTGGVLAFTSIAMMTYPAIYGVLLAATDSYRVGFFLGAIPAIVAAVIFVNPPVAGPWTRLLLLGLAWCLVPRRLVFAASAIVVGAIVGAVGVYVGFI
jgi:hypothetical protein